MKEHDHGGSHRHRGGPDHAHAGDGADHDHDHAGELRRTPVDRLRVALILTSAFLLIEVVAGVYARSLALLSDAIHMLTDAVALALALFAQRVAQRPRTATHTYGSRRVEILAAFVNGVLLGISSLWIAVEAARRWHNPPDVRGGVLLAVALAGLAVNLLSAWVLIRGRGGHNVNTRAALAHVLADAAGSVGAIIAGVAVRYGGWHRADPAISLVLAALILWGAWGLIDGTARVLMEGAPTDVDVTALETTIRGTTGVSALHDLHVWTVAEGFPVVTVHVVLDGEHHGTDVARDVCRRIAEAHSIDHVTVQVEAPQANIVPLARIARRGR